MAKTTTAIRKIDKNFARELDFKEIKFMSKIEIFTTCRKQNCNTISIFGYNNRKNLQPMFHEFF